MLSLKKSFLIFAAFFFLSLSSSLAFADDDYDPHFGGLGVHAIGYYQSPIRLTNGDCLDMNVFGGAGWYLKGRVNRYLSIEFINDYIYAKYRDHYGDVLKVPISLGLQGHFLDYGPWDVYLIGDFSMIVVALLKGGNVESMHGDNAFLSLGGQFGVGFSHIFKKYDDPYWEMGLEIRYVVEEAPKRSAYGIVNTQHPIHGVMFSLNIGLYL